MYSEAKSEYSFIFKFFLSYVAFPTLSNQNYRETESSAYERCCVRFHKRHSFVLVALAAHSFASFLVRYVFPLRATPHEKSTLDMSIQFLTTGSCLIAVFFENVRELLIAKGAGNNRHSLIDIIRPYRPFASGYPFIFYSCFLCF